MLGVSLDSSSTTSSSTTSTTLRRLTSSTTETTATTAAPPTTVASRPSTTTAPAPPPAPRPVPPSPTTTAAPATTTTVRTVQTVSGTYVSPDGDGIIEVELHDARGRVVASQITGPTGGDFSFAVDPGTYRLQITDSGPGPSENRTSSQVVTRTDSFTLEAGRSARFDCHVRTGCSEPTFR